MILGRALLVIVGLASIGAAVWSVWPNTTTRDAEEGALDTSGDDPAAPSDLEALQSPERATASQVSDGPRARDRSSTGGQTEPTIREPSASGRITVSVTNDAGDRLAGASVRFTQAGDSIESPTDARGIAMASDLVWGRWQISVTSAVHAPRTVHAQLAPRNAHRRFHLRLTSGKYLRGRVLSESDQPIHEARVDWSPEGGPIVTARTASDGSFRMTGLAASFGQLRVTHPSYRPHFEDFAAVSPEARVIRLAMTELRIRGRVIESGSELPIEGVIVRSRLGRADRDSMVPSDALPDVTTDSEGRFSIVGLRPGWIHLTALHEDFAPGSESTRLGDPLAPELVIRLGSSLILQGVVQVANTRRPVPSLRLIGETLQGARFSTRTDDRGAFSVRAPVHPGNLIAWSTLSEDWALVPPQQVPAAASAIELRVARALTVSGSVVDARSRQPVAGANVRVEGESSAATDFTDEAGRFVLAGIPATSAFGLIATHVDYMSAHWETSFTASSVLDIVIAMEKGLRIRGRVQTPIGEAVPDAQVRVRSRSEEIASVASDGEGGFRTSPLPPGSYVVLAEWREERSEEVEVDLDAATEEVVLTIGAGPFLHGRFVDENDSRLAEIRVQLRRDDQFVAETRSDERGHFRFDNLEEGALYDLDLGGNRRFELPELSPWEPSTQEHVLRLIHRRVGVVEGHVETTAEALPGTISVEAHRQDQVGAPPTGERLRPASETGRFRLDDVPVGDYRFVILAEGFEPAETTGRVEADRVLQLGRIVLSPRE